MVTAETLRLAKAAMADIYSPIARGLGGVGAIKLAYDLGSFVATHAAGGGITQANIDEMFGGNPGNPAPPPARKKRKANRYAILLKQEMKKSRLKGKGAAGQKKKFAAAAKKASILLKKEKKDGRKKRK